MSGKTAPGQGVDASGAPVVDPTQNVLDLVEASVRRLDDLRKSESDHLREMMKLRAEYDDKLRIAEAARIDAIRAVDVGNVQRAAEVAATQATVLNAQLVATAEAARTGLVAALDPIQEAINDLRRAQYEAQGATAPNTADQSDIKELLRFMAESAGQRTRVSETRLNLGAILGLVSVLMALGFGVVALRP